MKQRHIRRLRDQQGFTLIELMVVLVIIAIISVIAYPSYTQYVVKAKRSAAQSMLLQVADRQQQFFMDNKRYAVNMTELGFPSNPFDIGQEGEFVATGADDRIYRMQLTNVTATTFTAQAVPQAVQASKDSECGTFTYDHTGAKGAAGDVSVCW